MRITSNQTRASSRSMSHDALTDATGHQRVAGPRQVRTSGGRYRGRVGRLVDAEGAAAGERHLGDGAPALGARLAARHAEPGHPLEERAEVVAHQVQLVAAAPGRV